MIAFRVLYFVHNYAVLFPFPSLTLTDTELKCTVMSSVHSGTRHFNAVRVCVTTCLCMHMHPSALLALWNTITVSSSSVCPADGTFSSCTMMDCQGASSVSRDPITTREPRTCGMFFYFALCIAALLDNANCWGKEGFKQSRYTTLQYKQRVFLVLDARNLHILSEQAAISTAVKMEKRKCQLHLEHLITYVYMRLLVSEENFN